jgi:hypothetical protein
MGVKESGRRDHGLARQVEDLFNISTFGGGARIPRASLLAGASLVAIVALGEPGAAWAGCTPWTQTISTGVTGPVLARRGH